MPSAPFRHKLYINDTEVTDFFDLSIVQKCNGGGLSGTVSMQLNFKIKEDVYNSLYVPKKAEVKFDLNGKLLQFFVNRRSKSGIFVSFSCLDRMALTDVPIVVDDLPFDDNDTTDYVTIIQRICSICGFSGWLYYGGEKALLGTLPRIKKSDVYGKTCRAVLEEISKACCGIWITNESNELCFVTYGSPFIEEECIVKNHAKIETGLTVQKYDGVIMVNGDEIYTSGSVSEGGNVLTINTLYASQDMADGVMNILRNVEYQPFTCSKAEIGSVVHVGSTVRFKSAVLLCNSVTIRPRAYGVYAELGCNSVEENEIAYNGELTRALNNCIKGDADYNGCMFTRYQGLIFTAEETSKAKASGNTVKKQYGFNTSQGGITEYDGAMVSKVVPKSATWNSDKTEAVIDYGGKKFKYKIARDSSGNVTGFSKEEVTQ